MSLYTKRNSSNGLKLWKVAQITSKTRRRETLASEGNLRENSLPNSFIKLLSSRRSTEVFSVSLSGDVTCKRGATLGLTRIRSSIQNTTAWFEKERERERETERERERKREKEKEREKDMRSFMSQTVKYEAKLFLFSTFALSVYPSLPLSLSFYVCFFPIFAPPRQIPTPLFLSSALHISSLNFKINKNNKS